MNNVTPFTFCTPRIMVSFLPPLILVNIPTCRACSPKRSAVMSICSQVVNQHG